MKEATELSPNGKNDSEVDKTTVINEQHERGRKQTVLLEVAGGKKGKSFKNKKGVKGVTP